MDTVPCTAAVARTATRTPPQFDSLRVWAGRGLVLKRSSTMGEWTCTSAGIPTSMKECMTLLLVVEQTSPGIQETAPDPPSTCRQQPTSLRVPGVTQKASASSAAHSSTALPQDLTVRRATGVCMCTTRPTFAGSRSNAMTANLQRLLSMMHGWCRSTTDLSAPRFQAPLLQPKLAVRRRRLNLQMPMNKSTWTWILLPAVATLL
mmetsp:Transcript_46396/g.123008  ORF Transcript_46396/g.123008 Transcript_46396/m.123008 type:complete len:205 (+) Transcript_46396:487-1101(+)